MWSKLGAEEEGVENIPLRNRNSGMSLSCPSAVIY